jgi:hypothetical protein
MKEQVRVDKDKINLLIRLGKIYFGKENLSILLNFIDDYNRLKQENNRLKRLDENVKAKAEIYKNKLEIAKKEKDIEYDVLYHKISKILESLDK